MAGLIGFAQRKESLDIES